MTDQDIEAALQTAANAPGGPEAKRAQMDRAARTLIFQASATAATDAARRVRAALEKYPVANSLAVRHLQLATTKSRHGNLVEIAGWEDCG